MTESVIHKYVIPILYTLLWALGIYSATWDWGISALHLPFNPKLVEGAFIVYLTFMVECVISLIDVVAVNKTKQFNIKLIYWLIFFISNVTLTIITSFVLFRYKGEYTCVLAFGVLFFMCSLKYMHLSLTNNIDTYMEPVQFHTYISTF